MTALRAHYTEKAEFVRRVDEVQRSEGYRLLGAFDSGGRCLAAAGFRELHTLAWGHVIYVDDLSTHPDGRRRGFGRALLDWVAGEAARLGCDAVHLDSGVEANRLDAHRLYLNTGMRITSFHFAKPVTGALIEHAERLAVVAERELEALVAVSSPSGDRAGAEECVALASAFLPAEAEIERADCSSPGHAPDLIGRLRGDGAPRVVLLGHLDTVVAHAAHRPLERDADRLTGSGAVDMKGGVALALGLARVLAERPGLYAELDVLLVNDEEWRTAPFVHAERFRGFDACLCFEAGERTPSGDEAVIVRRKAAGTLQVEAHGRPAHSGSAPHKGRNALLALAAAAQAVAACADPQGPDRLTAVPTIMNTGEAFNVVPAEGRLVCDLRADRLEAFEPVLAAVPDLHDEVRLHKSLLRAWPGMDSRAATAPTLEAASKLLGRPVAAAALGGASDASHMAAAGIELVIDGLGPRGGGAHAPHEWVSRDSLRGRAEVALAVAQALLGPGPAAAPRGR